MLALTKYISPRSQSLMKALEPWVSWNCFNPSYLEHGGRSYITFRALGPDRRTPFCAYLLIGTDLVKWRLVDLSLHMRQFGVEHVSDPKLFVLTNVVWVTFNTGYSSSQNDLYMLAITPELGSPLRCLYSKRQAVEKNWAFFMHGGRIHALYTLTPPVVLQASHLDARAKSIYFEDSEKKVNMSDSSLQLAIGTQLAIRGPDHYFLAHLKVRLLQRRIYFGVPMRLSVDQDCLRLTRSRSVVFHSYLSLLGTRRRFNKNLWSCTYFSGLHLRKRTAILGYGVNDTACHFREVGLSKLW